MYGRAADTGGTDWPANSADAGEQGIQKWKGDTVGIGVVGRVRRHVRLPKETWI